jgi:hypothetical protein
LVVPKEDLLWLWPLLPYERPQLQKVLFKTSRKPALQNLPGSYITITLPEIYPEANHGFTPPPLTQIWEREMKLPQYNFPG